MRVSDSHKKNRLKCRFIGFMADLPIVPLLTGQSTFSECSAKSLNVPLFCTNAETNSRPYTEFKYAKSKLKGKSQCEILLHSNTAISGDREAEGTWATALHVERGSSVAECRTRNQVSAGSNPPLLLLEDWAFSFSPLTPLLTQLYK